MLYELKKIEDTTITVSAKNFVQKEHIKNIKCNINTAKRFRFCADV